MTLPLFINGRFLNQPLTGVQRYARHTLLAMDAQLAAEPATARPPCLVIPPGTEAPALQALRVQVVGQRTGHLWEQLDLPRASADGLLLNFGFTGPVLQRRQIITVHDAAVVRVPQSYSLAFRWGYRLLVQHLARRADRVFAVSQFSAREAQACFGAPAARVRVMTEGWQHMNDIEADERILDQHQLRHRPFLLAVSSPTPNKNFALVADALSGMGEQAPLCVVAGSVAAGLTQAKGPDQGGLQFVGRVSDGELKALYQSARAFVFPSLYEGFGIPPLEAMACGCPVLASTADAVVETCGDAALYFDPRDAGALRSAIDRLWQDHGLRAQLLQRAEGRLAHHAWQRAAQLHFDAIREIT